MVCHKQHKLRFQKDNQLLYWYARLTMLMDEFPTAEQYNLPIKVIVINNNILGMIRWKQMAFLGNPEFGVEFSPIDWVKFAEACNSKGYAIKGLNEVRCKMNQAMKYRKQTIVLKEIHKHHVDKKCQDGK
jgi:pyruvate dehydrogenase (quinone)